MVTFKMLPKLMDNLQNLDDYIVIYLMYTIHSNILKTDDAQLLNIKYITLINRYF